MKQTPHKLLSTAAAVCLIFGTTTSVFAQTEFAGSLNTVSISDAAGTNKPPTASYTYTQDGDTFTFDAGSSLDTDGSITEYKWKFSDGTTATGVSTTYTPSTYPATVTLTVLDNTGGVAITQSQVNASFEIILDDADSSFTATTHWVDSTSSTGYYNTGYKAAAAGFGEAQASWQTSVPYAGDYEIFCLYTAYKNRASNAPHTIQQGGATIGTISVNQTINGSKFFSLGTFSLSQGEVTIALTNNANGYVIADAVKITTAQ